MKIIGSDYDGTLNVGGIGDDKRAAIRRWQEAGNFFALVSGRHASNVRELHLEQNFGCDYFVGSNGAVIMNAAGDVVHADYCDLTQLRPLIEYLYELGCPVGLVHSVNYFNVFPDESRCTGERAYTIDNMPPIPYFTQVSTFLHSFEEAAAVSAKVRDRCGTFFNPMQNGLNVDIVRADVNKATGLYRLMELVGAEYGDVITVGDNVNDWDMIKEFRSYAMESGVQAIRDLATFVTPGVAELIDRELAEQAQESEGE